MKLAIISDIHDNLARLKEVAALSKKEKITTVICCGDVTSLETIEELSGYFKKVYVAFGNGDFKIKQITDLIPENITSFGNVGVIELAGKKIAFCHYDWLAEKLFQSNNYDFVFYGHTHTPWEERKKDRILLNPGEVAGQYGKASFAIVDIKTGTAHLNLIP